MELEIYKTLIISTGHLSPTILDKLDPQWKRGLFNYKPAFINDSALGLLDRTPSGWRMYIPYAEDKAARDEWLASVKQEVGEELANLIYLTIDNDCRYLEFHLDGPELNDYPMYIW